MARRSAGTPGPFDKHHPHNDAEAKIGRVAGGFTDRCHRQSELRIRGWRLHFAPYSPELCELAEVSAKATAKSLRLPLHKLLQQGEAVDEIYEGAPSIHEGDERSLGPKHSPRHPLAPVSGRSPYCLGRKEIAESVFQQGAGKPSGVLPVPRSVQAKHNPLVALVLGRLFRLILRMDRRVIDEAKHEVLSVGCRQGTGCGRDPHSGLVRSGRGAWRRRGQLARRPRKDRRVRLNVCSFKPGILPRDRPAHCARGCSPDEGTGGRATRVDEYASSKATHPFEHRREDEESRRQPAPSALEIEHGVVVRFGAADLLQKV